MKTTEFNCFVGIDISKTKFDVALLVSDEFTFYNKFDNNQAGYQKFSIWLKSKKVNLNTVLFCMEKTGYYSIKLFNFLFTNKCKVWLEDPIKIAKSNTFKRGKSDKIDAKRIAIYASKFFNTLNLFEPKNEIYL